MSSRRTLTSLSFLTVVCPLLFCPAPIAAQMQMPAGHSMPSQGEVVAPEQLPPPVKLTGIGNLHFPISSKNAETQAWVDQGMNLVFDFWDYEANRAFEQAIRTDPNCAICHWALSESLGIHNEEVAGYAHDELMKAIALRSHADKREKMYIDAAIAESGQSSHRGRKDEEAEDASKAILRQIVKKYPSDLTARLLLSEAVEEGYDDQGKAKPGTVEAIAILQQILKEKPDDSAANHLWIHAVEASPHPEQALHSAEILATLAPSSGHMTHMPGHIFYRTGDYQRAQVSFDLSTAVDEAYMKSQDVAPDNDWNYVHNLMYSIANLLEAGRQTDAAAASRKLTAARGARAATLYPWSTRDSISRLSPLLPIALRKADWEQVVFLSSHAETPANLPHLKQLATALTDYASGMTLVNFKDLEGANRRSNDLDAVLWRLSHQIEQEAADAKEKEKDQKPENKAQPVDPNGPAMLKNLSILSLELRGAILISDKKVSEGEALFDQARHEETKLGYREPPAFIRPVAEQEAELLIAAEQWDKAEAALKQALIDRPNSGYPLFGLAQVAELSGTTEKTRAAFTEFLKAWKDADANLPQVVHAQGWLTEHPDRALASSN
jgi:tetratricopeptide (TPR) repeat protein